MQIFKYFSGDFRPSCGVTDFAAGFFLRTCDIVENGGKTHHIAIGIRQFFKQHFGVAAHPHGVIEVMAAFRVQQTYADCFSDLSEEFFYIHIYIQIFIGISSIATSSVSTYSLTGSSGTPCS